MLISIRLYLSCNPPPPDVALARSVNLRRARYPRPSDRPRRRNRLRRISLREFEIIACQSRAVAICHRRLTCYISRSYIRRPCTSRPLAGRLKASHIRSLSPKPPAMLSGFHLRRRLNNEERPAAIRISVAGSGTSATRKPPPLLWSVGPRSFRSYACRVSPPFLYDPPR